MPKKMADAQCDTDLILVHSFQLFKICMFAKYSGADTM